MRTLTALLFTLFITIPVTADALMALPPTDDTPVDKTSSYFCPQLSKTLQRGSRDATTGGQVTELQTFLTDYFDLDESAVVSGFYGKVTQKYVAQFQQQHGLPAFGITGTLTRAKISEVCKQVAVDTPVISCPMYSRPVCTANQKLVESEKDARGCPLPATCISVTTTCPMYNAIRCSDGEVLMTGERLQNGCAGAPYCKKNSDVAKVALYVNGQQGTVGVIQKQKVELTWKSEATSRCFLSGMFEGGMLGGDSGWVASSGTKAVIIDYRNEPNVNNKVHITCNLANGTGSISSEVALYLKTTISCPMYNMPLCVGGEVISGGKGADGCELPPRCVNQNVIGVSIDPYVQPNRQIGDIVSWTVKVQNAQQGSSLVTSLQAADSTGRIYAFPGDGASRSVAGSSVIPFTAKILSQPGYDILPGKYKIRAQVFAPADGSGKDSAVHADAETHIFTIGNPPVTKCGVNTVRIENACANSASFLGGGYSSMYVQCYDGYTQTLGDVTSCKSPDVWQGYAQDICKSHCAVSPGVTDGFRTGLAPAQQQIASPYESFIWVVNSLGNLVK